MIKYIYLARVVAFLTNSRTRVQYYPYGRAREYGTSKNPTKTLGREIGRFYGLVQIED